MRSRWPPGRSGTGRTPRWSPSARWRRPIAAVLAKIAGDELLVAIRPTPEYGALLAEHGQFGLYTIFASWAFAVVAVATAVLGRRASGAVRAISAVSAVVGLVALVLVVITGDLGSTSVWGSLTGVAP